MELMGVTHTDAGTIRVSIGHPDGVLAVEGSYAEIDALCTTLERIAALATAAPARDAWLQDVPVGSDVVKLGVRAGGRVRLEIVPAQAA